MFQGFSQESVDFLWGIRFNNERSWFQPRKEEFLAVLDRPMRQLAAQVTEHMNESYPDMGLQSKVSRIYRDARRLFGRGPYKDHLWFSLRHPTEKGAAAPDFYFEIGPDRYSYGMGWWDPTPVSMAKLRERIDRDPAPLEELARRLEGQDRFVLSGQEYKRPKGDPGPLLAPWYNRKWISVSFEDNCEGDLFCPELADRITEGFQFLMPYYLYLRSVMADAPPDHM